MHSQPPATPIKRRGGGRLRSDRGTAAVELALVLPVLLLMIFGIIDIGRLINAQMTVNVAAREAARAQAFGLSAAVVKARAQAVTGDTTATVTASVPCTSSSTSASSASVTVSDPFTFITPLAPIMAFFKVTLTSISAVNSTGMMACVG